MDRLVGSSAYQRSAQCASLHPAAQAAPASVLTDAALDLDNNATERVFAALLGRKNHHGARSERGTQRGSATVQPDRFGAVADLEPLGALSAPLAQVEERPGSPRSCRWAEEHRAHVVRSRASGSRARAHGARAHGARAVRERSSTAHEVRERPSELTRSVNAHRGSRGPRGLIDLALLARAHRGRAASTSRAWGSRAWGSRAWGSRAWGSRGPRALIDGSRGP